MTAAHLPSDVIGAFFVSSLWTALALAVLWRDDPLHASGGAERPLLSSPLLAFAVPASLASVVGLVMLITKPVALVAYVRGHAEFLVAAALIALIAQVLIAGLAHIATAWDRTRTSRAIAL